MRDPDENESRRILYQINKLGQLSHDISSTLSEFNARLLGFLVCDYNIDELRGLLNSLNLYVEKYMTRIGSLRETLLPDLKKINSLKSIEKIGIAKTIMNKERLSAPREFRVRSESADPLEIPSLLLRFYKNNGVLDTVCHRINDSALRVWRRMSTHLKELERKSHRIEDLRERMKELAKKSPDYVPTEWLQSLLSWGHFRGDMHHWDDQEKADPPRPRRSSWKYRRSPVLFLEQKSRGEGAVQSMEQTRLNILKSWIEERILPDGHWRISDGPYNDLSDFPKIMELARAGLLGNGKKLKSIDFSLTPLELDAILGAQQMTLRCKDMEVRKTTE